MHVLNSDRTLAMIGILRVEMLITHLAFHNVPRAFLLDASPASTTVFLKRYPPTSTSSEMSIPLPLPLCRLLPPNICIV